MRFKSLSLAAIGAVCVTLPAFAHHSHGAYLRGAYTPLRGTVTEVHWMNPHTWIYLEVKDVKGEPTVWALEAAGVTQLVRNGWTRDSVKVGDTISVRCYQLRDHSNGGLLRFLTPAGGTEKEFD
jgi:hypothetical protein